MGFGAGTVGQQQAETAVGALRGRVPDLMALALLRGCAAASNRYPSDKTVVPENRACSCSLVVSWSGAIRKSSAFLTGTGSGW